MEQEKSAIALKYDAASGKAPEVSAKGIPMSSEELRTRTGCRTGSDIHVFGCGIAGGKYLIAAARQ